MKWEQGVEGFLNWEESGDARITLLYFLYPSPFLICTQGFCSVVCAGTCQFSLNFWLIFAPHLFFYIFFFGGSQIVRGRLKWLMFPDPSLGRSVLQLASLKVRCDILKSSSLQGLPHCWSVSIKREQIIAPFPLSIFEINFWFFTHLFLCAGFNFLSLCPPAFLKRSFLTQGSRTVVPRQPVVKHCTSRGL